MFFYAHGIACAMHVLVNVSPDSHSKQTCVSTRCRKPFGISFFEESFEELQMAGRSDTEPATRLRVAGEIIERWILYGSSIDPWGEGGDTQVN